MPASQRFLELVKQMEEIHIKKNAGYAGDSPDPWVNFREAERLGVSAFKGVLVRMTDKFIRIINLTKNPANDKVGESIIDTLIDMAVYCLIAICLYEEEIERRKKSDSIISKSETDIKDSAGYPKTTIFQRR